MSKVDALEDVERSISKEAGTVAIHDTFEEPRTGHSLWSKLVGTGLELRGSEPVPVEKRTDVRYLNVFTIFATSMTSLLP